MYIIVDWANNEMDWGEFKTFDDALDELYLRVGQEVTDPSDEEFFLVCDEYEIKELL